MARPRKATVDYFPHYCKHGRTLFILQSKYKNDGYSFWFKLLEILGSSEGHYYDCHNEKNWDYLVENSNLDEKTCLKILDLLVELGSIDKKLWEIKVIWCDSLLAEIATVYTNRCSDLPRRPQPSVLQRKRKGVFLKKTTQIGQKTPQRGGEERRGEDTLKRKSIYSSDSVEYGLANLFIVILRDNDYEFPKGKIPDIQKWAKEFDLMIRVDGRDPKRIKQVMCWSQKDPFWRTNILSPSKLRKQWGQLTTKMKLNDFGLKPEELGKPKEKRGSGQFKSVGKIIEGV